jgi:hypothetical protein
MEVVFYLFNNLEDLLVSVNSPEYPGRHVVVCPRGFSCRIVEIQLDDFSSNPDSGAIFVVLLMPADTFETTSRGCTQVCICGVLAVRRFSQVRDPRMNFGPGLATSALEGTTDVPCKQEQFRL